MKKLVSVLAALTMIGSMGFSAFADSVSKLSLTDEQISLADLNDDGRVDISDASAVLKYYAEKAAGIQKTDDEKNMDINGDGVVNIEDASCILRYYAENAVKSDPSTDAFIPVADFLFSKLDEGTIKVGDIIENDDFKALAGEESELYKNSHSSYTGDLKPSEALNIAKLLETVSEDSPLYEYLQDTEKLDGLYEEDSEKLEALLNDAVDRYNLQPEDVLSPAGLQHWKALWDSYGLADAYILDNDTIVIDNGTGFLLQVKGIIITRNGKSVDCDEITVPDEFGYDGNIVHVYEKVNGYDNVYSWEAGL